MVQNGTPLPALLAGPPLSDRDAVADACYRAFASIDQSSEELLKSSVTDDVFTDIASKQCNGYDELRSKVWAHVSDNLDTVHYLTNVRVSIDSASTARVSFAAQAVHCVLGKGLNPETDKYTTGAFYNCDAVKVGDLWKLKVMKSTHVWGTGNHDIMKPPGAQ